MEIVAIVIAAVLLIGIVLFVAGRGRRERKLQERRQEAHTHRQEARVRGARADRAAAEAEERAARAKREQAMAEEQAATADRERRFARERAATADHLDPDRDTENARR